MENGGDANPNAVAREHNGRAVEVEAEEVIYPTVGQTEASAVRPTLQDAIRDGFLRRRKGQKIR